jgi:hypothetical protein
MPDAFWGLTPAGWTAVAAIGTMVSALAAAILVGVAVAQITSTREENRRTRTLLACDRYDTDPILDACLRRLSAARENGTPMSNTSQNRLDITSVLNYLDGIAVGISQGLYIEAIVRDHLGPIMDVHYNQYLTAGTPQLFGLDVQHFQHLNALCHKWSQPQAHYNRSELSWLRRKKK